MKLKALFPGSFDPFTAGHLNILTRALGMFDEVTVAIGINQDKRGFFSNEQKTEIIEQAIRGLENVDVIEYDGLTVDICRQLGVRHIVRGIETIIIPTAQEFAHISSSAVRDILRHHGDTSLFLPEGVILPEVR